MLMVVDARPYIPPYIFEMGKKDMYVTMALRDILGYCCDLAFGYVSEYDMEGSRSYLIGFGVSEEVITHIMEVVYNSVYQVFMTMPPHTRTSGQYKAVADIDMLITITGRDGYVPGL